jgi:carboxyl-terminal processing protease
MRSMFAGVQWPSRRGLLGLAALSAAVAAVPRWPAVRAQTGEKKLALVIGNAGYRSGALKNPVNDARAVGASLKSLGFEVNLRENTSLRELLEVMREFARQAPNYAVRVLFYAGHGIQAKGRNFLLPVDTEVQGEDELPARAADIGELIERLGGIRQGVNIVILDACRANPFAGGVFVDQDGRRIRFRGNTPTGLARLNAPTGTLIAYSTAPGGIAYDGKDSKHSLYTKHLLAQLATPGMPIELLFKRVRIGVTQDTDRLQIPWESSSLVSDFCFRTDEKGRCGS